MTLTESTSSSNEIQSTRSSRWDGARMTLGEFLTLPEEETELEYDDGLVTQKMAPHANHASLQSDIAKVFNEVGEARRLGVAFLEKRFVTPGWSPVPDVSFYRKEQIALRSRRRFGDFDTPPTIAVEIVSPDQSVGSLLRKCLRYAEVGVAVSLVVDADDESVFVVRPGQPLRAFRGADRLDLDDVLPGIRLTIQQLFDSIVPTWLAEDLAADREARDE
jgi:Uma2 family endonuclease